MSEGSETAWKGLHPASVAVNLLPQTWRMLRGAWPLLLAAWYGTRDGASSVVDVALLLFFFLSTVGQTLVHFLTLRYRVHAGRLEIVSGLLSRRVRAIDPERIQNTELVQSLAHKLTGLVEVRLETASGTEVEGMLSALTVAEAEALVRDLDAARARASERRGQAQAEEVAPTPILEHDTWTLLRFGATSTQVGALALVMVGVGLDALAWVAPEAGEQVRALGALGGAAMLAAVLSASWLAGLGSALLMHHRFALRRFGDRLVAERGLFTRRRVELRQGKVQVLTWVEPLVRRWLGFGSVVLESAAARPGAGGVEAASTLVPVVERPDVARLLAEVFPGRELAIDALPLRPPHPRALWLVLVGNLIRALMLLGASLWLFGAWGALAALAVPVAVGFSVLDHRAQGWLVTAHHVIAREGYWTRRTAVVARSKLQGLDLRQGPLERLLGTGRLVLRVAGSGVALPEIGYDEAEDALYALSGDQGVA